MDMVWCSSGYATTVSVYVQLHHLVSTYEYVHVNCIRCKEGESIQHVQKKVVAHV
jgi:hypothetical protein